MTPWLLLTAFVAAINLTAFIAVRGQWDRRVPAQALASVIGTVAGNAIAGRTGLELVRIGDFHLVGACLFAQLAMVVTVLLAELGPTRPPRDGTRADR